MKICNILSMAREAGFTIDPGKRDGVLIIEGDGGLSEASLQKFATLVLASEIKDKGVVAPDCWKDAILGQLAAHAMDSSVSENPTSILKRIIDMAVTMATDPVINGGWKLVPVEPTAGMRKAATDAWLDHGSKMFLNKGMAALKAGIAAAPEAP